MSDGDILEAYQVDGGISSGAVSIVLDGTDDAELMVTKPPSNAEFVVPDDSVSFRIEAYSETSDSRATMSGYIERKELIKVLEDIGGEDDTP